jgi:hypothetical protein
LVLAAVLDGAATLIGLARSGLPWNHLGEGIAAVVAIFVLLVASLAGPRVFVYVFLVWASGGFLTQMIPPLEVKRLPVAILDLASTALILGYIYAARSKSPSHDP